MFLPLFVITLCVLLDRFTKWIALHKLTHPVELAPFLNLTLVFNKGFLFGLGNRWEGIIKELLYLGIPTLFVLAVLYTTFRVKDKTLQTALSLIAAGGIGNLLDRLLKGQVVDFIDFHVGKWHYPAFNVADICVSLGVILLLFYLLSHRKESFNS